MPRLNRAWALIGWLLLTQNAAAEKLRLVADNVPMIIVYYDHELRYSFANQTTAAWYGMPLDRIVGGLLEHADPLGDPRGVLVGEAHDGELHLQVRQPREQRSRRHGKEKEGDIDAILRLKMHRETRFV
mgnify:CR=1 FL=1